MNKALAVDVLAAIQAAETHVDGLECTIGKNEEQMTKGGSFGGVWPIS